MDLQLILRSVTLKSQNTLRRANFKQANTIDLFLQDKLILISHTILRQKNSSLPRPNLTACIQPMRYVLATKLNRYLTINKLRKIVERCIRHYSVPSYSMLRTLTVYRLVP